MQRFKKKWLPVLLVLCSVAGLLMTSVFAEGVFGADAGTILTVGIASCLAGAVMGDHCSPISDTTILASTGAQCYHLNHVKTQLPYACTVAVVSFVNYVFVGILQYANLGTTVSAVIGLITGFGMMFAVLMILRSIFDKDIIAARRLAKTGK